MSRDHGSDSLIYSLVARAQYLDCFSAKSLRAVNTAFSCIRAEREYLQHTARSLGFPSNNLLDLPRTVRFEWYPLPERVLQLNTPLCTAHTAPHGFAPAAPACSCLAARRADIDQWHRALQNAHRPITPLRRSSLFGIFSDSFRGDIV